MSLTVYTALLYGHYPVGACAVVKAHNKIEARELLLKLLAEHKLLEKNEDSIELVPLPKGVGATMLLDGDY